MTYSGILIGGPCAGRWEANATARLTVMGYEPVRWTPNDGRVPDLAIKTHEYVWVPLPADKPDGNPLGVFLYRPLAEEARGTREVHLTIFKALLENYHPVVGEPR